MFHLALSERAGKHGKEHHAVIRYLVDLYGPRLVLTPHQKRLDLYDRPTLYEGKTPLHQAILSHDAKMVQFLVERGADVHARCTGSFFGATSHAYYGEYPLSFAVCTGQKEIARYLADNGALVNEDHDVNCCYALHLAVMSDRIACAWGGEGRGGGGPCGILCVYAPLSFPLTWPFTPYGPPRFSAVYDLLVDELGAYPTLLNIRGETVGGLLVGHGPLRCLLTGGGRGV